MNKKIVLAFSVAVVILCVWMFNVFIDIGSTEEEQEVDYSDMEVVETSTQNTGSNPFSDDISQEEMNDAYFQKYIHGMSHQKVEAPQKWSFYELTQERVEWLLVALDGSMEVKNKYEYKQILSKWYHGDFSTVDEDHNLVWEMQNGNIGKASGILSVEEEQEFIDSVEED